MLPGEPDCSFSNCTWLNSRFQGLGLVVVVGGGGGLLVVLAVVIVIVGGGGGSDGWLVGLV